MIELDDIILCVLAGILAGIINTLAGSGSVITLSLLSFIGLPVELANGTNRIGIFFQSSTSSLKFYQKGQLSLKGKIWLLVLSGLGAALGVYVASQLKPEDFKIAVGFIFCILFFVILLKPQNYIKDSSILKKILPVLFGLIGFYAGFIQAGAGLFMLAIMNAVWGKSFTQLNPIKVFIVFLINAIALSGYAFAGLVDWEFGISLAIGQIIGALIGVRINNLKNNIEPVLRILLLGLILMSIAKFWDIF